MLISVLGTLLRCPEIKFYSNLPFFLFSPRQQAHNYLLSFGIANDVISCKKKYLEVVLLFIDLYHKVTQVLSHTFGFTDEKS